MQLQESELLATIGHAKILYTQPLPAYAQFYCKGRNANVQGIAANLLRIHSCTQKDHGVQSRACNKHKEPLFLYTRRSARGSTFVWFRLQDFLKVVGVYMFFLFVFFPLNFSKILCFFCIVAIKRGWLALMI